MNLKCNGAQYTCRTTAWMNWQRCSLLQGPRCESKIHLWRICLSCCFDLHRSYSHTLIKSILSDSKDTVVILQGVPIFTLCAPREGLSHKLQRWRRTWGENTHVLPRRCVTECQNLIQNSSITHIRKPTELENLKQRDTIFMLNIVSLLSTEWSLLNHDYDQLVTTVWINLVIQPQCTKSSPENFTLKP